MTRIPRWTAAIACGAGLLLSPPALPADAPPPGISAEAIKSATTPEQHQAIADAYAQEAKDAEAKALAHRHMDSWYAEPGYLSSKVGFPRHCRALTQAYETEAREASALAQAHRAMADQAAKKAK